MSDLSSLDGATGNAGTVFRNGTRLALLFMAAACAALPLFDRVGPLQLVAFAAGAGTAGWLAFSGLRGSAPVAQVERDDPDSGIADGDPMRSLLANILPVWLFHFGSVKDQTEEAVTALAQSFAAISARFQAAGFEGARADATDAQATFSLLTLCERELTPVISSMTSILDSKKILVESVGDLSTATQEMRGMADDVGQIAAHTNMLAINAAIAAAHAGDAGRGFAVIAKEIRGLSATSSEAARRIGARMGQVEQMMKSTIDKAEEASQHDREAIELSGSVIHDVLSHVRQLGQNADAMREEGVQIRAETESLLTNLQFQDRVSQISAVLDGDLRKLQDLAEDAGAIPPPATEWLAALDQLYTMDSQRAARPSTVRHDTKAPAATEEVVFF